MLRLIGLLTLLVLAVTGDEGYDDLVKEIFTSEKPPSGGSLEDLIKDYNNKNPLDRDGTEPKSNLCDSGNGECVPYHLCSGNNQVITDGAGLIDIR